MSDASELTSAVYWPVSPSDLIALAMSGLAAFGVPAVPVNTRTLAGLASAGAAPSTRNAATNASALDATRQIGGRAALRTSIRSLLLLQKNRVTPTPARR